jgi:hypothetical protein
VTELKGSDPMRGGSLKVFFGGMAGFGVAIRGVRQTGLVDAVVLRRRVGRRLR